tara:strand:- start:60 stop:245 length:186 start_codon:yes stop_codon:yes gene_type:complete
MFNRKIKYIKIENNNKKDIEGKEQEYILVVKNRIKIDNKSINEKFKIDTKIQQINSRIISL